jgi:RNA polymerase sigma-70 factor (ECF subfamily)
VSGGHALSTEAQRRGHSPADRHAGADRDASLATAIADAKAGDWNALQYLYARYADDVYRYVLSMVRDVHEAEDVTHTVFMKLMGAIAKYEPRDVPFKAWIIRVARNAAVDHLRRQRLVPCEEVRVDGASDQHARLERTHCLKIALQQLPPDQRRVLVLRHIAGLSPMEIAERLGKTEASIHGLHHRARGALRAALRELELEPLTAVG